MKEKTKKKNWNEKRIIKNWNEIKIEIFPKLGKHRSV